MIKYILLMKVVDLLFGFTLHNQQLKQVGYIRVSLLTNVKYE